MKKLICLFLFCFATGSVYSQINKENYLKNEQLYLTFNKHHIPFDSLTDAKIVKLLGKPDSISKKKWETTGAKKCRTYFYKNGKLFTEDNDITFINLEGSGWSFSFKINKAFQSFKVGDNADKLRLAFPLSWKNKSTKGDISIPIKTDSGVLSDAAIIFTIKGSKIYSGELFFNES